MTAFARLQSCTKPPYLQAILSGILVGTSYIPFPPWAVFFCFVPLWSQWMKQKSASQIFWTGWTTQFVLTLIGFNWVSHTVHEFGHLPWPVAILVLFIFCAFAHLHYPMAGVLWFWTGRKFNLSETTRLWLLPVFMNGTERLFPMIFDWHLGYTWLWSGIPAYQTAEWFGFMGLATVTAFFNLFFLMAFLNFQKGKAWLPWALTTPILFGLLTVIGLSLVQSLPTPDLKMRALLVQANIGNQEKLMAESGPAYRDVVVNKFFAKSNEGLKAEGPADFIVWPETAFPEVIPESTLSQGFAAKLKEYIVTTQTRLITGGYSIKEGTNLYTNSFFVIGKNGEWTNKPYHKTHLLAFGEYIPLGDFFPIFYEWLPYTGHFGRGPGPSVLQADGIKIGAQICYEGLFDHFNRGLAQKGAQVIVNVTNDSWYGKWEEPYQHLYMTLARAVEVRRPLIRSTNTGISTVIEASGRIHTLSPLHEPWFKLYEVPYYSAGPVTWFTGFGFWLLPLLMLLGLGFALLKGRQA